MALPAACRGTRHTALRGRPCEERQRAVLLEVAEGLVAAGRAHEGVLPDPEESQTDAVDVGAL